MADETDCGDEPEEGSGDFEPVYTPKSIGNEFAHLVGCLSEIAQKTHTIVYDTNEIKKQLTNYDKKPLYFLRPFYKREKAKIMAHIEDLEYLTKGSFERNYENCKREQIRLDNFGVLPTELTFQNLDIFITSPINEEWLHASILSDTKVGQVRGEIRDYGTEKYPFISVSMEKSYKSSPKDFIKKALEIDGMSFKKTLDKPASNISFYPNSDEKTWFKSVLSDSEILKNHFDSDQFFSEIAFERNKKIDIDPKIFYKEKNNFLETNFDMTLETYPESKQPNVSFCIEYSINANRTHLDLPQEELKWLEDVIERMA